MTKAKFIKNTKYWLILFGLAFISNLIWTYNRCSLETTCIDWANPANLTELFTLSLGLSTVISVIWFLVKSITRIFTKFKSKKYIYRYFFFLLTSSGFTFFDKYLSEESQKLFSSQEFKALLDSTGTDYSFVQFLITGMVSFFIIDRIKHRRLN